MVSLVSWDKYYSLVRDVWSSYRSGDIDLRTAREIYSKEILPQRPLLSREDQGRLAELLLKGLYFKGIPKEESVPLEKRTKDFPIEKN